jgi:hypothetical protein
MFWGCRYFGSNTFSLIKSTKRSISSAIYKLTTCYIRYCVKVLQVKLIFDIFSQALSVTRNLFCYTFKQKYLQRNQIKEGSHLGRKLNFMISIFSSETFCIQSSVISRLIFSWLFLLRLPSPFFSGRCVVWSVCMYILITDPRLV